MNENPYEPSTNVAVQSRQEPQARSALASVARRIIMLIAIFVCGMVGIVLGVMALTLIWPQVNQSKQFLFILMAWATAGGVIAGLLASIITRRVLAAIGL